MPNGKGGPSRSRPSKPVGNPAGSAALHLPEELLGLLAAGHIGLLARLVGDLRQVVADLLDREAALAEVDALGLHDARAGEGAGAGGQDGAGGRLVRAEE